MTHSVNHWVRMKINYTSWSSFDLVDESVVIFLHGNNILGKKIYCYLEVTLDALMDLNEFMKGRLNFQPSDFGTIIYSGYGSPSLEIEEEMLNKYNMKPVPNATN
jgi:hypothetical protein